MSTQTELTRLQTARNKLRTKGVELGINTGTDKLDVIAAAFEGIENKGAVTAQVQEGESYTIPKGYHNGSGTVSGVKGGGNYNLQSKKATPTKKQQNITPDSGYYGLSDVTVDPIPDNFQDVSPVTAGAADVLANKVIVAADGSTVAGTMPNNGTVSKVLDAETTSQAIAKGYHSGSGSVSIVLEEKSATPTKESQDITPTAGKVLKKVSVSPIPDEYQDVSGVTAGAADVLANKVIVAADGSTVTGTMKDNGAVAPAALAAGGSYTIPAGYHSGTGKVTAASLASQTEGTAAAAEILSGETAWVGGSKVTGSMPNNGATGGSIDGLTSMSLTIPAGYTTGGTVSLTSDIEEALAAI